MIITRAEITDLVRLTQFRVDAARWLAALGSDQWSTTFPSDQIAQSIRSGEVFVVRDSADADDLAATITLDGAADPLLWTPQERQDKAQYVHKLTVDRKFAGLDLGTRLLDWAGDRAARHGAQWLRLDAWTSNIRLQQYYTERGFQHVRTIHDPEAGGSGWVAQRPAELAQHGFDDRTGK
ncbi:GNAT family N-acetyltransferase [Kitasatospora aureofaciens]|uniref:N-acetyltransferase n=1 Tax=Kitasatospora aureofaciens TaxID=1894 RepID=A0A1E7NE68_KITAU|nr:GNAT family N-acetyltransferase [Kitasatospora aureofaciens]ARF83219.1 N-acetyltransferase [Kitasatospora aureofaciens]OEV38990.1 GNAT family N-acetyltransferase [Kitasatospora aureofaciens]GGU99339.1 N-acetyltransferase [Kitasatospora aureofaciens]